MMRYPEFPFNPEPKYLGLTPKVLAETAEGIWQKKKDAGNSVSKPVALGLAMKSEGRDILKSVLSVTSNIAPDITSVFGGLTGESQKKFSYGLGEIVLGSILEAVEKGVFEWDDEVFVSSFNESIMGTPIPKADLSVLNDLLRRQPRRTAYEQTEIIRKSLKTDTRFLSFLESSPSQNALLPQTISAFIYGLQPAAGKALAEVLPVYKEALTHLKPMPSPTGSFF